MLNRQMFGMKKLTTYHLTPYNKPPKVHVSNWVQNSHTNSALHQELITTKSSWFRLHMGENRIPKVEWQMIPQLPNQPMAFKFFSLQIFCSFTCIWLSSPKMQRCKQFVNPTPYAKDMNFQRNSKWKFQNENKNENSKMKIKMIFCPFLGGQIV